MNMDNEELHNEPKLAEETLCNKIEQHLKIQRDLIRLMKVLDGCIENVDNFYCYAMKKQFLATSTPN